MHVKSHCTAYILIVAVVACLSSYKPTISLIHTSLFTHTTIQLKLRFAAYSLKFEIISFRLSTVEIMVFFYLNYCRR